MRHMVHWGFTRDNFGDPQTRYNWQLWVKILMEYTKWLVGVTFFSCPLRNLAVLPITPCSWGQIVFLSILVGVRNELVCLAMFCTNGEAGCLLTCSYIFLWEKLQVKKVSFGLSCAVLGKDNTGRVKLFLLPSSMHPVSDIFLNIGVLELDSWTSQKAPSSVCDCQH